uniref:EOG090X0784 n=1 Tax=Lynceus sp. MCZ IZ 141354 TaxID=1930659 RepID=A0A9N6WST0_9CRUS|nr:EOG090X0784 [Lynceus sp. MCZ IZ 141354]
MKWEFTSWVPLVSKLCPSDTYKVYKQGSKVRIDTTLLGFEANAWQRGNRSYIFKGEGENAVQLEIDHDSKKVYVEQLRSLNEEEARVLAVSSEAVINRLTTPIVTTYIDTDKISFERTKSGLWGWRSDKVEVIDGKECKVFNATNVELVTKTRSEHLTEADKANAKSNGGVKILQSILGVTEDETKAEEEFNERGNPCHITPNEYFDADVDLDGRDIGRPKEQSKRVQKFKATLWLCQDYPLHLQEQIMPIVDLMAISSSHFAKLKDFIQMQLPAGFPVKIEIPLLHVMNACITFGNVFAIDAPVEGVTCINEGDQLSAVIDDSIFEPHPSYTTFGSGYMRQFSLDEDDQLLQMAIQQSLVEAGSENDEVDLWEALKAEKPISSTPSSPFLRVTSEEQQLQRAIEASLSLYSSSSQAVYLPNNWDSVETLTSSPSEEPGSELAAALALSARESKEEEQRRKQEEETLQMILQLSLVEK